MACLSSIRVKVRQDSLWLEFCHILSRDIQWLNSFWKEYKKRRDDSKKLVDEFYTPEEDDQTQDESETDEPRENEIEETKDSSDGNNTEEQKKLGIDIQMIGAREKELGRTRSQTKEMMSKGLS